MVWTVVEWVVSVTSALVLVVIAVWRWRRNKFNFFKKRGIPGPEPNLLSGHFHQLWNKDTLKVLDKWSDTYGDIYGIFNGDSPFLMVKDLDLLRNVFVKDFALFVDRGDVWGMLNENPVLRNNISFAKGHRWKFVRRSISMAFTAAKLRCMINVMCGAVDRFLDLLESKCRDAADGEANVHPLLGKLAFDVVAETACGLYLDVQHKPDDEYFNSARSFVLNVIESAYQRIGQFFTSINAFCKFLCLLELHFGSEPLTGLARIAQPIAELRSRDPSLARPDLINSLLEAKVPEDLLNKREFRVRKNEQGEFLMPLTEVASNAASALTAGFETMSANTSHCVFCLAKYPEVQEKVRQEVNAAYEKYGGFSYDTIFDLTYTTQVLFESLRLYSPVIAFTSRKASKDYRYKDMILPKGISIMACTQQIHMDPRFWDKPEEFNPERFSPEQKATRDPLAFQPYGIGPRNCVGMKLAQLTMTLIIAKLVHRFRVHLSSRHKDVPLERKTQSIIASPRNGVWVSIERIQ